MEPFILYQALICLIVALTCTATGFLLGLHHAQRKAELKPTNEAGIQPRSVRRPYSSSFSPCHCGAKSKDGCCCQTASEEEADGWEDIVAKWASEQTSPFTALEAIKGALRLQEEKITKSVLTRMGMALRKIGCPRVAPNRATGLYAPPPSAAPAPHPESPAQHESRHMRPSRIDTPAGSGLASTRILQPQAQATQAAFSASSGEGRAPSQ